MTVKRRRNAASRSDYKVLVLPSSPSPLLYSSPLFQAVLLLMVVLVVVRLK